jgi:hypothetical protein
VRGVWEFRTETCKVARNPCGGGGQGGERSVCWRQKESARTLRQGWRIREHAQAAPIECGTGQSPCCPTPAGGGTTVRDARGGWSGSPASDAGYPRDPVDVWWGPSARAWLPGKGPLASPPAVPGAPPERETTVPTDLLARCGILLRSPHVRRPARASRIVCHAGESGVVA